ncbi:MULTISPECIES: [LysW]-lysine hydrolase [Haloarcula]|uniref:Putative [LysW]-lysine/[LysW]-ornithine hydrolase n=1 Tax=Haloarcula pellucida TaxID=1427151 RepID=A0A830GPV8_9EURY|nr:MULTISPECIES: [LysW]-lysine hydrolase [Halomicroarcula]MBX0349476.1 [LysW]-lysine hydrolase [Halomicroarcula pellucida]MDS0278941.1 [LysW]-lysine hydrolase [Halomicroarcula sp. S1AR25-4]GGO02740.1 acetyl-lysine deacetylase [Halomicroarcula pellucida]
MSEAAVEEADTEARELLEDVVRIPSVTPEEREAAERLVEFFEAHDREVWIDDIGNVRAPADDGVLLTSHVDTVPGDIPVRIEETDEGDVLWGRGSVDAKGPLCSMAVAAVRTGASFVGVVGEEVDSRGARYLVSDRDAEPDAVVNGEPSGWEGITLGYRGLLGGTYVATSESGHSSRPENNAIQDAIDWWAAVEDEFDPDEWVPVFERVTCKPVDIDGGISEDGLSVEATMDVQLRVPPEYTTDEIREIADGHLTNGTVHWDDKVEPVMQSPRTPVARAFRAAIRQHGGDPTLLRKTGTSDMNVFAKAWDCPMATYGPGDSDLDHAPNEHIHLAEYDRAVGVLTDVTERLL